MDRTFYKSLDREIDVFGLRGAWLKVFLFVFGGGVIVSLILGSVFGTGIGVAAVIICIACDYFACLSLQVKVPGRQLDKQSLAGKTEGWAIRRETLSRILLEDPMYKEVKQRLREMKRG